MWRQWRKASRRTINWTVLPGRPYLRAKWLFFLSFPFTPSNSWSVPGKCTALGTVPSLRTTNANDDPWSISSSLSRVESNGSRKCYLDCDDSGPRYLIRASTPGTVNGEIKISEIAAARTAVPSCSAEKEHWREYSTHRNAVFERNY